MLKQPRYYNREHALPTLEHGKPNRASHCSIGWYQLFNFACSKM